MWNRGRWRAHSRPGPGVGEVVGVDLSPAFLARRELASVFRTSGFVQGDGRARRRIRSFDVAVFHTTPSRPGRPRSRRPESWWRRRLARRFDGDYATTTRASGYDPFLQACVEACVETLVYDRWLVWRSPNELAGLRVLRSGAVRSHGYAEAPSSQGYMSRDHRPRACSSSPPNGCAVRRDTQSVQARRGREQPASLRPHRLRQSCGSPRTRKPARALRRRRGGHLVAAPPLEAARPPSTVTARAARSSERVLGSPI